MVKKVHYDVKDGQKGSLGRQRLLKRQIMKSEMVKGHQIRSKKAHYDCHRFTLVRTRRFRQIFLKFLF